MGKYTGIFENRVLLVVLTSVFSDVFERNMAIHVTDAS